MLGIGALIAFCSAAWAATQPPRQAPTLSEEDVKLAKSNLIVRIDPKYPTQAARDGLEGWVMLSYTIDNSGRVTDITVLDASPHSLLPVAEGSPDRVLGVVKVRDILSRLIANEPVDIAALMSKTEVVPDQLDAVDALRVLQQAEIAMAMVHDEYGHLDGIVTPVDLLTALVGDFASDQDPGDSPGVTERADGSLLVSGSLSADVLADRLGIEYGEDREFGTAAGYALHVLKRLPNEGDHFTDQGWRFEVVDMDGRRIDKLLVSNEADGAAQPA